MSSKTSIDNKTPIALVLSGGAALGAAHIGVMRVLEGRYRPNFFVGTSAGAIVAAALACGLSANEISDYLKQKSLLKVAFDFSFRGSGLIRGKKILELLKTVYQDKYFEDLPKGIELAVCATDFASGLGVLMNKGSIAEAVRASLAVPGIFEPYWIDDRPLVDGGLVANLPLDYATEKYKGEKIIAVDVCSCFSKTFPPKGKKRATLRQTIERAMRIIFLQQQLRLSADPRVTILRPELEGYTGVDILSLQEIEQIGVESAKQFIADN